MAVPSSPLPFSALYTPKPAPEQLPPHHSPVPMAHSSSSSGQSDSDDLHAPELTSGPSQHSCSSALEDTDTSPTSPTFRIPELPLPQKQRTLGLGIGLGGNSIPFPPFKSSPPLHSQSRSASPGQCRTPIYPSTPDILSDDGYDSESERTRSARLGSGGRSLSRQRTKHHYHHHIYQHHQPRVVVHGSDSDSDEPDAEERPALQHRPAFSPRQSRASHAGVQISRSPSPYRRSAPNTPSPLSTPREQSTPKALSPNAYVSHVATHLTTGAGNNRYLQVPEANGELQLAHALHGLGIRRASMPAAAGVPAPKPVTPTYPPALGLGISVAPPLGSDDPNPATLPEQHQRIPKKAALSSSPRRPSGPPIRRPRTRNVSPLAPRPLLSPPVPPRLRGSPLLAQLKINTHPRIVSAPALPSAEEMHTLMLGDGRMHKHRIFLPDPTAGKEGEGKRLVYVVTPPPTGEGGPEFDGVTTVGWNPYFKVVG